jgi:2-oxoglutarate ferredoxin oxidoreductase subunit alpha
VLDRLSRKIQGATKAVPQPVIKQTPGAKVGLVTVGGCHAACVEAMDLLAKDGIAVNYLRVRGFPFGEEVRQFLEQNDVNFIVEQNRDAQLRSLLMLDLGVHIEKLESVRYYAGFPMSASHVIDGVKAKLEKVA